VDQVADDLQKMIVAGFFKEAYVDVKNKLLVMTRNGEPIESVEKSAAVNRAAKRKAAREKGVVPESIDDLITMTDDGEIKGKLRSLRTITNKIDQRIEERPELEDQVKDFREKYYPEVVRLTDEYNEKIANLGTVAKEEKVTENPLEINTNPNYLEEQAQDIKKQLISLIDSVTEASENLLERLHEDDIMDISTDIKMLQTTLASKGLLDSDFDL
jgi:DNA integrity scanning protein DisA with diadenylate cyclase activity